MNPFIESLENRQFMSANSLDIEAPAPLQSTTPVQRVAKAWPVMPYASPTAFKKWLGAWKGTYTGSDNGNRVQGAFAITFNYINLKLSSQGTIAGKVYGNLTFRPFMQGIAYGKQAMSSKKNSMLLNFPSSQYSRQNVKFQFTITPGGSGITGKVTGLTLEYSFNQVVIDHNLKLTFTLKKQ
jgi:hypothetical protein